MYLLIFFVAHWYLSLFSQTFFDHRYASHRAFTMSPFWEKFFFIFAFITQGSSYLTPRGYAIMHRMHHAYTDTERDPHSPQYSKNLFTMMWGTYRFYSDINNGRMEIDKQFTKNLPSWESFDKFAQSIYARLFWVAVYVYIYYSLAPNPWWWILLPITIFMNPVHGVVINWFAHKYGYTNHKMNNTSKNLMPVDVFMLGEGYHNDHHHHPSNANFGSKWYEIDPVYYVIRVFDKLGIVQLNKAKAK